ncbi:hypothetical protein [Streptomyces sp. NPDC020681]|uniref:hypothetical protein n=1 Tax=Streptomyces sp. NPDC020681 TaxID=3365083 RepID=UPI003789109F
MAGWEQLSALGIVAILGTQGVATASADELPPAGGPWLEPVCALVLVEVPPPVPVSVQVSIELFGDCAPPPEPAPPRPAPPAPAPPGTPAPSTPPPPPPAPEPVQPARPEPPAPTPKTPEPEPSPEPEPETETPTVVEQAGPPAAPRAVRNYRPAPGRRDDGGTPLTILMLVTSVPAVLAAAMLRPRSGSASSRRS